MLKYVQMELAEGALPDGKRYISKDALLARRAPQVPIGKDATYGMGLMVDTTYGMPVVHHGGDMIGFHSDMMWLPEQQVGAVVLTNARSRLDHPRRSSAASCSRCCSTAAPRPTPTSRRRRRRFYEQLAAERKLLTVPADAAEAAKLAPHYVNAALGEIAVSQAGRDDGVRLRRVAERGGVAARTPTARVVHHHRARDQRASSSSSGAGPKQTLIVRDAQHEYVFKEGGAAPAS